MVKHLKTKEKQILLRIGNMSIWVTPIPEEEVRKANARIQKNINKTYNPREQKKIRANACITASKIFLNA